MHDRIRTVRRPLGLGARSLSHYASRFAGAVSRIRSLNPVSPPLIAFALVAMALTPRTGLAVAPSTAVDPFEVHPPRRAEYTRWDVSQAARDEAALTLESQGVTPSALFDLPRVSSLLADVEAKGLGDVAIPPHRLPSSGVALASTIADPVAASRFVARTHPSLVGVAEDDLLVAAVDRAGELTYVHCRQAVDGLPVLESHVVFQWDTQGRLRLAGSDVFAPNPLRLQSETRGSHASPRWISMQGAKAAALSGMPADTRVTKWEVSERAWYPLHLADGSAPLFSNGASFDFVPVWNLRFQCESPVGRYDVLVDGETGAILGRTSQLHSETFEGAILGTVEWSEPGDTPASVGMPEVRYRLRNESVDQSGATDQDGLMQVDVPPGTYQLSAALSGERVFVQNARFGLATPADEVEVQLPDPDGDPLGPVLTWGPQNSLESDRDVYFHANVAYQSIREIDPGDGLTELDVPMLAVVDDVTGTCNAYWNGTRVNFYAEGGGCNATGRIADVIYHEYGHAVTEFTYAPFSASRTMHEGFSDYFAATIRNDPVIGRSFRGPGTLLRDIEIDRVFPDDIVGEVHRDGLIIAGALWDLRTAVGKEVADRPWHYACYGRSKTFDDYFTDLLIVDDDDADLFNGTPHVDQIVRAFRAHGIGDYSIDLSGAVLPDVEAPGAFVPISVRILTLVPIGSSGASFFHSTDGGNTFERAELTQGPASGEWTALIPSPPEGSTIHYYWSFTNQFGDVSVSPENAPAAAHSFYVGRDDTAPLIVHVGPTAITQDTDRVHLRALIADNTQRLSSVRAELSVGGGPISAVPMTIRPVNGLLQPQGVGTVAFGEFMEYQADLALPNLAGVDRIEYRILADDSAVTTNTGSAPLSGFFLVPVRRGWAGDFESEPGPLEATGDWEWGEAGSGLSWSGSRVWATNLDGTYSNATESFLTLGPIDLTDYERARFEFRHRYRFEKGYDGAEIEIRTDGSNVWGSATPEGGYPGSNVDALDSAGYTGDNDEWERVLVPLDYYLGDVVWIRLRAASEAAVADLGWYVDDMAVLEAQAHIDPKDLSIVDGADERVELTWRAPTGVDLTTSRWLGFHIYRRELGQERDREIRLTGSPLRNLRFVDTAGLVNGTTYIYRITTVHDDGESLGAEGHGRPYAASVSVDEGSIGMNVADYLPVTRTFGVRNLGSGLLDFDVLLADPGKTADETVARFVAHEEGERVLLVDDPSEGNTTTDISRVYAEEATTDAGRVLRFTIEGEWDDPHTQWGGLIAFDTDGDLSTSQNDFSLPWGGVVNLGYEYFLLFGGVLSQVGFSDPSIFAVVLDVRSRSQYAVLADVEFPTDGSIQMDLPRILIGDPQQFRFQLAAGGRVDLPASDFVPDLPRATEWFRRTPKHGQAIGTASGRIDVTFDNPHAPAGTYRANLLILSNDRATPELSVPITVQVNRTTPPPTLFSQSIFPAVRGMEIRFVPSPALPTTSVGIERQDSNGDWVRLERSPLLPDEHGVYSFLDRFVGVGTSYRYRIPIEFEGGSSHAYGPLEAIFAPIGTPQTFPAELPAIALGSNAEGLELEFEVPEVFDPLDGVWIDRRPVGSDDSQSERMTGSSTGESPPSMGAIPTYQPEYQPEYRSEYQSLLDEPLFPAEDRRIRFLDPWATPFNDGVEPGVEYEYRIRIELPDDTAQYLQAGRFEVPLPTELRLLSPRPSPFRNEVVLRFDLPTAQQVKLEVFDVNGRRRVLLEEGPRTAGTHQLVWDGRDGHGDPIESGVYWMRLATAGEARTVRILRVK